MPTETQLRTEFDRAEKSGLLQIILEKAQEQGLSRAFVLGIASRETGIQNILGDGGHGHGVLQIDDRFHKQFLKDHPDWQENPGPLITYGCKMLAGDRSWALTCWPNYDSLKIAAASYNAGQSGAARGIKERGNADAFTTGGDYGEDVLARAKVFAAILAERRL